MGEVEGVRGWRAEHVHGHLGEEDENGERARAKAEVIADMPPEPPSVMELRSELLVDERPRLVM